MVILEILVAVLSISAVILAICIDKLNAKIDEMEREELQKELAREMKNDG